MSAYDVRRSSYCGETFNQNMANPSTNTSMGGLNGCQEDINDVRQRLSDNDCDLRDNKRSLHGSGLPLLIFKFCFISFKT